MTRYVKPQIGVCFNCELRYTKNCIDKIDDYCIVNPCISFRLATDREIKSYRFKQAREKYIDKIGQHRTFSIK